MVKFLFLSSKFLLEKIKKEQALPRNKVFGRVAGKSLTKQTFTTIFIFSLDRGRSLGRRSFLDLLLWIILFLLNLKKIKYFKSL